jgi:uncharacterized membrane protein (TIGR02234 family)
VLVGAGGATLASVSAGRDWATASAKVAGMGSHAATKGSEAAPLALALALVCLAAWGAILVARRNARRVVALIGFVSAVGAIVSAYAGAGRAKDDAVGALVGQADGAATHLTGWYAAALVGATLTALAFVAALVLVRDWPEMSGRYDAPGSQPTEPDQTDLWKSLDEGHDPTV